VRYSVQNLDELKTIIIPYFKGHGIFKEKENDFKLWAQAVDILNKNKGKILSAWDKKDLVKLLEIQKTIQKFKKRPKKSKWFSMAESLAKNFN